MIAAYRSVDGFNCKACGNGIGQMILTVVIAGSIWSIIEGVQIYTKSNTYYDKLNIAQGNQATVVVSGDKKTN